jgi:thiamine-phosphate pyrophosphorylase
VRLNREAPPRLYPILDASLLPVEGSSREARLRALADELLAAGVTLLQYRNKTGNEAEVLADTFLLRAAAPRGKCLLILNDFPALAVQVGFDGAHVGQEDMATEEARAVLGAERILGVSTHNPDQLAAAELTSAD